MQEGELLICFRVFRGGYINLGVKSPWWAKNIEAEVKEVEQKPWRATAEQIDMADRFLFHILPKLELNERKILISRCGSGFPRSFRKCGKDHGLHHEVFRKQYQQVIVKVQKILDEIS